MLFIGSFYWHIKTISVAPMKISGTTHMMQLHLIIGIFSQQFPDKSPYKHCYFMGYFFLVRKLTT
jgi:hypothetical protein